ncbi:MAG: cytochrome c biogenesis protein CcsA [Parachlamydia sp.]|nr:cytochrome c biogenesis protein CcsA [Parachlamydia sp.]
MFQTISCISAFLLLFCNLSFADANGAFPVLYKGRIRPAQSYARLFMQEQAGADKPLHALMIEDLASSSEMEERVLARLQQLQNSHMAPADIQKILDREFPLLQRLQAASPLFLALPGKTSKWLPLNALTLQTYDSHQNDLKPIGNFTRYSNKDFLAIQRSYMEWRQAPIQAHFAALNRQLIHAYESIAGRPDDVEGISYPSFLQLKAEQLYNLYQWTSLLVILYTLSFIFLVFKPKMGHLFLMIAFFFHTALLGWRMFILLRPPVTSMMETLLYVPWIAVLFAWLLGRKYASSIPLLCGAFSSAILLSVLDWMGVNQHLDNLQPVLNSQLWLVVHVLLVVASYGLFLLGSVLAHFYLFCRWKKPPPHLLSFFILQTLYFGTACLIAGTLLGGVWAAESWGRFWDWDPKEAWAFISICTYLAWVHAYRMNHINELGLAYGAVIGFLSISFTWYGVNYILGTGLHSYGFGNGGEIYYYAYLGFEALFLIVSHLFINKKQGIKQN